MPTRAACPTTCGCPRRRRSGVPEVTEQVSFAPKGMSTAAPLDA